MNGITNEVAYLRATQRETKYNVFPSRLCNQRTEAFGSKISS